VGAPCEAPPSTPSRFSTAGTGSATLKTVTLQHEADRHADAEELRRQAARRKQRGLAVGEWCGWAERGGDRQKEDRDGMLQGLEAP